MTTVTWLGLLIIVAIAAFFLGSFITKKQFKHDELEVQAQQAKHDLEQYRQDVSDHLAGTRKLVNKMQDSYSQLLSHVEETNQLLTKERPSHPQDPFFSKETTEQLQASLQARPEKRRKQDPSFDAPPSDYAEGETGLFSGDKKESEQIKAS
ncbi:YhcB family protein [Pseudoalteromonas 'SMAR']|uniref:YhcB family protein n=1 Tax=Pseudoalteromonas 'SMAR' TaxID=3416908 RepID=UPI003AF24F54